MKRSILLFTSALSAITLQAQAAEVNKDNIIFKDGGSFYGEFKGLTPEGKVFWQRAGNKKNQEFSFDEISQVSINGMRPQSAANSIGLLHLTNGDKLPGKLVKLTDTTLQLETQYSGVLNIKRNQVSSFHPIPIGSNVLINGFKKDDTWQQTPLSLSPSSSERKGKWELNGSAYYVNPVKAGALTNSKVKLPDECIIQFNLSVIGRPTLNVVLHSDLKPPLSKEDISKLPEKEQQDISPNSSSGPANTFGKGIALQVRSSYPSLSTFSLENNQAQTRRHRQTNSVRTTQINEPRGIVVTIRASRKTGKVAYMLNGKVAGHWEIDPEDYPQNGDFLAFYAEGSGQGSLRISNLVVSEWSGVMDSAQSLVNDKKDILLLTNDTDRFAGKIVEVKEDSVIVKNDYAPLKIPLKKLRILNFATDGHKEIEETDGNLTIRFFTNGRLTGKPVASQKPNTIAIRTDYNQTIEVPLSSILSVEMEEISSLVETWNKKH